jgi:glutathione S-transferase
MKLYGSQTSPYVRRLRLLMENLDYEFVNMNIFEEKDRQVLRQLSPILKIPVLVNDPEKIYDSRQIFRYLCESSVHPKLDWEQENALTIIDGVNDSLIQLYMLKRSNIDYNDNDLLISANLERIKLGLDWIDEAFARNYFNYWDYLSMSLYCLLDWAQFRELIDLKNYQNFLKFLAQYEDEAILKETDPRLTV